jgi:hypothetical protein
MALDHGDHPQVIMIDHIVRLDKVDGFFVREVASLAGDLLLRLGQQEHRLTPPPCGSNGE